jgi:hypothetical protein
MATLDETNIFGLTPNQPEKKDDSLSRLGISESGYLNRLAQIQNMRLAEQEGVAEVRSARGAEKKVLRDQYLADLAEAAKDPTQEKRDTALESFFETPFMFQMGQYIPDPTGLPTDIAEAEYSGRKFKESREARGKGTEFYPGPLGMGDRPYYPDMTPEEAGLKLQQGLAIGSIPPGIGGIAGIAQSMIGLPSKVLRSKTMDGQGGGSGGISDIPPEPKKDYAGFVSSVEKAALGPIKFGTGNDLIKYLESKSREGVSQNELKYIDFDQIRNNPDLTKEDVIKYIQENRPNIYRVERVEDNPTYKGGAELDQNELSALPYNEDASRILNEEEANFYFDEYLGELDTQNTFILENETLKNNNYVLDEKTLVQDPDAKNALKNYLGRTSDAFYYLDEPIIRISYADGNVADFGINQIDDNEFFKQVIRTVDEDGAEVTFPPMTKNLEELAETASEARVSPDYGGQIDIYEDVGESGTNYQIIGSDEGGYQVIIDGERTGNPEDFYNDLVDARGRIESEAFERGDIKQSADSFDNPYTDDQLIDIAPMEVIQGEATLPTKFGYQYGDYRLPMGGADNYREFTLHIENPKTATRYSDQQGVKHFGGGDELLHYRTTDRIDEDGKKVLFVEEIQSDLHSTASSTRERANYEIGPDTKKQAVKELRDIFKDNKNLRVADDGDIIKLDADSTYDTTNMLTAEEVSNVNTFKDVTNFGSNINLRKLNVLSDAEVKNLKKFREKYGKDEQVLPDFPYKGNAYIELAVKDIMKLASEGDYDRVAFTNPATQLRRNNKSLEYIDEIEINQVPKLTEAEQQFNENWMRNRDRSMVSQMQPESVTGFDKIRIDGPLADADLNSFVSTHTDFVVNDPQANKLWQDFHKSENLKFNKSLDDYYDEYMVDNLNDLDIQILMDNIPKQTVNYVFGKADKPLTPTQVAEEVQNLFIKKAKFNHLRGLKNKIENLNNQDSKLYAEVNEIKEKSGENPLTEEEFFGFQESMKKEIEDAQGMPVNEILTLDQFAENVVLPDSVIQKTNQNTRRAISSIMRDFYDHTLPNVEDAGKYIVKQKGTGYKIDDSKFMVERGDITEGYGNTKFDTIDEMIKELRLDENLQERIRKDELFGHIPESTTDSQIYKVEAEGGSGKKPLDMYARIIPQQVEKFAQKYNKNAKPQLKRVLYNENLEDVSPDMLYEVYKGRLGGDDQDMLSEGLKTHEAATIDITPEMRKAILTEGVNVMYKGGIVNKVKSMDKPIQGNTREM